MPISMRSRGLPWLACVLCACGAADTKPVEPSPTAPEAPGIPAAVATTTSVPGTEPSSAPTQTIAPPTVEQVGKTRGALGNEASAIAAFRSAWVEEVVPGATTAARNTRVADWSESVRSRELKAERTDCKLARERVDNTLGAVERTANVLFASISALAGPRPCWQVAVTQGKSGQVLGYLDVATGALVFVWLVPEG